MKQKQLCRITLSANAGFSLIIEPAESMEKGEPDSISKERSARMWFDALHEQNVNEFSTLSENIIQKMMKCEDFFWPDVIAYTHCHKDHFSAELTEQAIALWPEAQVIVPEKMIPGQITLCRDTVIRLKGAELEFIRTTHEGEEYRNTPHFACIVRKHGKRILITGDSEVGGSMLKDKLTERGMIKENSPDIVIAGFPWITLKKGRDSLDKWLWPSHLVINHLPFPDEDEEGFNVAAEKFAGSLSKVRHVIIMNRALQQESIVV